MNKVARTSIENCVEEPASGLKKSAVLAGHKYLPPIRAQLRQAREFGIEARHTVEGDISAVWIDDVSRVRSTRWDAKMPERQDLLKGLVKFGGENHMVFFETPVCVGFSKALAEQVIAHIHGSGASFFVRNLGKSCKQGRGFEPQSSLALFWEQHRLQLKAAQVRISRRNVAAARVAA